MTCFPGDYTVLESHQINCERMPKPVCQSSLPAVKIEETCGCRWMCPCEYLSLHAWPPSPSLEIFIRNVMPNGAAQSLSTSKLTEVGGINTVHGLNSSVRDSLADVWNA